VKKVFQTGMKNIKDSKTKIPKIQAVAKEFLKFRNKKIIGINARKI
jgi:hypothetical protein